MHRLVFAVLILALLGCNERPLAPSPSTEAPNLSPTVEASATPTMKPTQPPPTTTATPSATTSTPTITSTPTAAPTPLVVVLGDSYSSGWQGVGIGRKGWPAQVANACGWRVKVLAVPGTGYQNPGWTNEPMRVQAREAIALAPDIIILAGGHNDILSSSRFSPDAAAFTPAARSVVDKLRAKLPETRLVIVGPIWPNTRPPKSIVNIGNKLSAIASDAGTEYIDASTWFGRAQQDLIAADGEHPTTAGHRYLAGRFAEALGCSS